MGVLLYLMRHGAAEDVSPSGRDADRALTVAGSDAVRRVALALRITNPRPLGKIIASPLVRAQQTADIIRSVLCPHLEIDIDEDLTPDESAYDLAVRLFSMTCDTLLVGHQPNIEMVARAIVAPRPAMAPVQRPAVAPVQRPAIAPVQRPAIAPVQMPVSFRTATVVGFHVEGRPPPYRLALAMDPSALPEE